MPLDQHVVSLEDKLFCERAASRCSPAPPHGDLRVSVARAGGDPSVRHGCPEDRASQSKAFRWPRLLRDQERADAQVARG